MNIDQIPDAGTIVYLRPGTKLASAECYAYAEVEIVRLDLPLVVVRRVGRTDHIVVHHQNLSLHRPRKAAKEQHDQSGGHEQRRVPTLPRGRIILDLPDGWEEQGLW